MAGNHKVAFIGAGSMAESIFSGLLQQKKLLPENILVTNRQNEERLNELYEKYGVQVSSSNEQVLAEADVVILAMKPAGIQGAIESIRPFITKNQLFISVLAGITTDYISYLLKINAPVVRVMPNTSAAVGSSATVITAGKYVKDEHLKIVEALFQAVGMVKRVKEADLDGITALAGSGPAFMYYLVEALYKSAEELGLDRKLAEELILQMIQGSVDLLQHTDHEPFQLYESVKSPGGTTEAGLNVLEENHFQEIMMKCIKRAAARSKEITEELSIVPV
ncbi:pyrroline-5-carboxylate reductase [Bacillus taeanensis]|uniref:Pyrroline-5-carboxylate reductase n=1 Tax=Bacillus taeanensis TaxID=273032 RepID=A0A366Y3W7_9BACI|nr:pyrroline-5-carboxylate reductase [Bacillus taeanensis]RBW71103.1 pyrroline-5-carboxylate reductase [Bacillus taeanensis]